MTTQQLANSAEAYAALGWIPLTVNNKIPRAKSWQKLTRETWKESYTPTTGIAIQTGPQSGILVVDIDVKDDGMTYWTELLELHTEGEDVLTYTVKTGGGGLHLYFQWDERCANLKSCARAITHPDGRKIGIDIRGTTALVVAPPTIHSNGVPYRWVFAPEDFGGEPPARLPDWLYQEFVKPKKEQKKEPKKEQKKEQKKEPTKEQKLAIDTAEPSDHQSVLSTATTAGPQPQYGEVVTVDGQKRVVNLDLVREVLTHVPCPAEQNDWGGLRNEPEESRPNPRKVSTLRRSIRTSR